MAYRFKLAKPVGVETRRIILEQVDRAIVELSTGEGRHAAVHEARKCLKRARALLRLARYSLGKKTFSRENRRLRDIARGLAGTRESQAMIECVTRLQIRFGPDWNEPAVAAVKSWLYEARRQAEKRVANGARGGALAGLAEARGGLATLAPADDLDALMAGLQESYGRGRKALARAYAERRDEDFHEWRKWVQQHWRQMQLLSALWPEMMAVRITAARELSELLGDDHDLYVLQRLVRDMSRELTHKADMAAFVEACRERQAELRALACPRGLRLFAEAPEPFRARMAEYWICGGDITTPISAEVGEAPLISRRSAVDTKAGWV